MTSNVSSTPTEKQPFGIAARRLFSNSNTDDESGPDESFFRSASRVSNISLQPPTLPLALQKPKCPSLETGL